jgi:hypothetical protein
LPQIEDDEIEERGPTEAPHKETVRLSDGVVELDGGVLVSSALTEADFLAAAPSAEGLVANGIYRSYSLPSTCLAGEDFGLSIFFADGSITELHLVTRDTAWKNWNEWSEKAVTADKAKHDAWLLRVIGHAAPYDFPWGEILSVYDRKGGFSLIIMRYKIG